MPNLNFSASNQNLINAVKEVTEYVESLGRSVSRVSGTISKTLDPAVNTLTLRFKESGGIVSEYTAKVDALTGKIDKQNIEVEKITTNLENQARKTKDLSVLNAGLAKQELQLARNSEQNLRLLQARANVIKAIQAAGVDRTEALFIRSQFESGQLRSTNPNTLAVAEAWKRYNAEIDATKPKLEEHKNQVDEIRRITGTYALTWQSIFRIYAIQLMHRALSLIVQDFKQAFDYATKMQVSIAEIQTIDTGKTPFDGWLNSLRVVSDKFGIDLLDQIETAYQTLSNQVVNNASDFVLLADKINKFALVAKTDAATSIDILSSITNAYNYDLSRTNEIFSQVFQTIYLGRVRAEELKNTLGKVLAPAAELGITFPEIAAAISSMTIQGVKADQALTLIRNVILKLINPTKEMKELFAELGVTNTESAIATYGWVGLLQKLNEKSGGLSDELTKLFGRINAITGGFLLSGKSLNLYNEQLEKIKNGSQQYGEAVQIVLANAGKQVQIEFNKIANFFKVDFGNALVEGFAAINTHVVNLSTLVKGAVTVLIPTLVASLATIASQLRFALFGVKAFGAELTAAEIAANRLAATNTRLFWAFSAISLAATLIIESIETTASINRKLEETASKTRDNLTNLVSDSEKRAREYAENLRDIVEKSNSQFFNRLAESIKNVNKLIDDSLSTLKRQGKFVTNQLQEIDSAATELVNKTKSDLTKVKNDIEKLNEELSKFKSKNESEQLLAQFESLKSPRSQVAFAQTQIGKYIEELKKAKTPEELNIIKARTDDWIRALRSADEEVAKLTKRHVNLQNVEEARKKLNVEYEAANLRITDILTKQEEALKKSLEVAKEYETTIKDLTDAFRDFDVKKITSAESANDIEQILIGRYNDLQNILNKVGPERAAQLIKEYELEKKLGEEAKKKLETAQLQNELNKKQNDYKTLLENLTTAKRLQGEIIVQGRTAQEQLISAIQQAASREEFDKEGGVLRVALSTLKSDSRTGLISNDISEAQRTFLANRYGKDSFDKLIEALNKFATVTSAKEFVTAMNNFRAAASRFNFDPKGFSSVGANPLEVVDKVISASIDKIIAEERKNNNNQVAKLEQQLQATKNDIATLQNRIGGEVLFKSATQQFADSVDKFTNKLNPNLPGFATGGIVPGRGNTDSVLAMLTPGEFVVNRMAASAYYNQLQAMNSGGQVTNVGGITVNVQGGPTSEVTIERLVNGINRAVRQKRVKL